jgi:hypothetical protein
VRHLLGLVGLGVALAILASFTTAFSTGAEVVSGTAIGMFVLVKIAALVKESSAARARRSARALPGEAHPARRATAARSHGVAVWGALGTLAIAFELCNYFLSPRNAHPTVSYFLAEVAAHPWSRGVLFAAWLALGAYLVRR